MISNVKEIPTQANTQRSRVSETLQEASKEGFVDVILVGLREDKTFTVIASPTLSCLTRIGMLEVAKQDSIEEMKS